MLQLLLGSFSSTLTVVIPCLVGDAARHHCDKEDDVALIRVPRHVIMAMMRTQVYPF